MLKSILRKNQSTILEQIINLYIVISIFFISFMFIPCSDDFYFMEWEFTSLLNLILMKPENIETLIGVPDNGRYIGNTIGIILSKLYNTDLWWMRNIFMSVGIFIIIYLVIKLSKINERRYSFLFVSFLVFIAIPNTIFREVYSWTAGYVNYLLPVIGMLILLNLFNTNENSIKLNIFIAIVSFTSQLYVEHMTFYFICFSLLNIYIMIKDKKNFDTKKVILIVFTFLGSIIMILNTFGWVGSSPQESYRTIGNLYTMISNLIIISESVVFYNIIIISLLFLFVYIIINNSNKLCKDINKIKLRKYNICLMSLILIYIIIKNILIKLNILELNKYDILASIIFAIILSCNLIKYVKDDNRRKNVIFYIISIIVVNLPLLIVNPVGPRNCFISYIFLILILLEVYKYLRDNEYIELNYMVIYILYIIISIVLMIIYYNNYNVFNIREKYLTEMINKNNRTIELPYLPYRDYTHFDKPEFFSYSIIKNNNIDVNINMKSYSEWKKIYNELH